MDSTTLPQKTVGPAAATAAVAAATTAASAPAAAGACANPSARDCSLNTPPASPTPPVSDSEFGAEMDNASPPDTQSATLPSPHPPLISNRMQPPELMLQALLEHQLHGCLGSDASLNATPPRICPVEIQTFADPSTESGWFALIGIPGQFALYQASSLSAVPSLYCKWVCLHGNPEVVRFD